MWNIPVTLNVRVIKQMFSVQQPRSTELAVVTPNPDFPHQTNTHSYDGTLPWNSMLGGVVLLNRPFNKTIGDVAEFLVAMRSAAVLENDPTSVEYLIKIVDDWGTNNNLDTANNIRVEELIFICARIWDKIKTSDIANDFAREFHIQLSDMQTGPCPQGRTTRIWQIAKTYLDCEL